ncbi:hypothetical protein D3C85_983630 [compost metagenome]
MVTKGLVDTLPRPKKMLLTTMLRFMAAMTAWRTFRLSNGGLRMLKIRYACGENISQPAVVYSTLGSARRRLMSTLSTSPPRSTSTLPRSNATAREAASGITLNTSSSR